METRSLCVTWLWVSWKAGMVSGMLHLQLKSIGLVVQFSHSALPQLFKPNFSHPNNPQLFSAFGLLSYFKLSLKQSVFPPRNLHHIGLQQCVMLSHIIAGCLRLKWLRYSFFCHIIYIFCFPAKRRLQKGGSHWWRCLPAATHPHTYVTTVFLHLLCLVVQIQVVYKQCDRVNGSEISSEEEV